MTWTEFGWAPPTHFGKVSIEQQLVKLQATLRFEGLKVSGGSGLTAARQLTSAGLHAARQVACGEVSTLVIVAAGVVVVFAS